MSFKDKLNDSLRNISESVLDYTMTRLDPKIWDIVDSKYILRDELRQSIIEVVESNFNAEHIQYLWLIGSITGFNYNEDTDIDVHIIPNSDFTEYEEYKDKIKALSDQDYVGKHPIQYYLHEPMDAPDSDGIWDIYSEEWLKWEDVPQANINDYYKEFMETVIPIDILKASLFRDLIDYKYIHRALEHSETADVDKVRDDLEEKLDDINIEIDLLIEKYQIVKDERSSAYYNEFDPSMDGNLKGTIDKYSSGSLLPGNVVYKLIERYMYKSFISNLKKFTKENGEVDDISDVDEVLDSFDLSGDQE